MSIETLIGKLENQKNKYLKLNQSIKRKKSGRGAGGVQALENTSKMIHYINN